MAIYDRTLLNDGHYIPHFGYGLWQVPAELAADTTAMAIHQGYRLIDTAEAYYNERQVGEAIARAEVERERLFVTTKVWNINHGYDQTLRAFDESLERLGLEQVELYLMHWPAQNRNLYVETWRAMIRLQEEGRARSIGVSNFAAPHLQRVIEETGIVPALNQIELHPYFQQRNMRALHEKHGIKTQSWSPLGIWKNPQPPLRDPLIQAIARKHGRTPAQVILRWHLDNGLLVISKSVHAARIAENSDIFDFHLDDDDLLSMAELDRADGRLGPDPQTATF